MSEGPAPRQPFEALVRRTAGLQPWRRVLHAVGGSCVAGLVHAMSPASPATRWLFGTAAAIAFVVDLLRLRSESLNRLFFRTFPRLLSPREADGTTGFPWFLLGVFAVSWPSGGSLAVPSILVLAFADPAAATVGRLAGRRPLGKGTVEGTLAFLLVAVVVLTPFVGVWAALPVAALVAAVEVLPWGLDDNLTIPVATAAGLWAFSLPVAAG